MAEPWHNRYADFIRVDENGVLNFLPYTPPQPQPPPPPSSPPRVPATPDSLAPSPVEVISISSGEEEEDVSSGDRTPPLVEEEDEEFPIPSLTAFFANLKQSPQYEMGDLMRRHERAEPILRKLVAGWEKNQVAVYKVLEEQFDTNARELLRAIFYQFILHYDPNNRFLLERIALSIFPQNQAALRETLRVLMIQAKPREPIPLVVGLQPLTLEFELSPNAPLETVSMGLTGWNGNEPVAFISDAAGEFVTLLNDRIPTLLFPSGVFKMVNPFAMSKKWSSLVSLLYLDENKDEVFRIRSHFFKNDWKEFSIYNLDEIDKIVITDGVVHVMEVPIQGRTNYRIAAAIYVPENEDEPRHLMGLYIYPRH